MAKADFQARHVNPFGLAANYGHLLQLDRGGWAWEWLRRNPDFVSLKSVSEERTAPSFPIVIRPEAVSESSLLRWGLHYG